MELTKAFDNEQSKVDKLYLGLEGLLELTGLRQSHLDSLAGAASLKSNQKGKLFY